jgi:hypothetical protein
MSLEKNRERVSARIRQAIAQSGADLSTLPAGQEARLVNTLSDGMLLEFDAMLNEMMPKHDASKAPAISEIATTSEHDEQLLWEGRPFLSLGELYQVTNDRIRMFTGLLARSVENVELIRLQDIDYHQGVSERILGIGDIYLNSVDASHPMITLRNVSNPEEVANIIRKAWLDARKRRGVVFRDIV